MRQCLFPTIAHIRRVWRTASLLSQGIFFALQCTSFTPSFRHCPKCLLLVDQFPLSSPRSQSLGWNLWDLGARDVVTWQDLVVDLNVSRLHHFELECWLQLCVLKIRANSLKFACFLTDAKKMRGRKFSAALATWPVDRMIVYIWLHGHSLGGFYYQSTGLLCQWLNDTWWWSNFVTLSHSLMVIDNATSPGETEGKKFRG